MKNETLSIDQNDNSTENRNISIQAQELNLVEMMKRISSSPLLALIKCDEDLLNSYVPIWNANKAYTPFPVSPKLVPRPESEMQNPATSAELNGLKLHKVELVVNPADLFTSFKPLYMSIGNFENKTPTPQTYQTIEFTETITDSTTITKTKTLKTGTEVSTKTELDVFGLGGVEVSAKVTVEGTWSDSTAETKTTTRTIRIPPMAVLVNPGKGVRIKAEVLKGELKDVSLKANASFQGTYKLIFRSSGPGGIIIGTESQQELYGYFKTAQIAYRNKFNEITGGGILFDDPSRSTIAQGLSLLKADVTSSSYLVVLEEYDLKTGKITETTPIKTYQLI